MHHEGQKAGRLDSMLASESVFEALTIQVIFGHNGVSLESALIQ
jgi:hypothetical protein